MPHMGWRKPRALCEQGRPWHHTATSRSLSLQTGAWQQTVSCDKVVTDCRKHGCSAGPWASKGRVTVCPTPLVTSPWPAMPCYGPGAGRASVPARRHQVTLADHLPQLHSSTAQSRVLDAARPFCFLGTASHSAQGCLHTREQPLPLLPWGKPRPLRKTPVLGRHRALSLRSAGS